MTLVDRVRSALMFALAVAAVQAGCLLVIWLVSRLPEGDPTRRGSGSLPLLQMVAFGLLLAVPILMHDGPIGQRWPPVASRQAPIVFSIAGLARRVRRGRPARRERIRRVLGARDRCRRGRGKRRGPHAAELVRVRRLRRTERGRLGGGTMEPGIAIPILPARDLEETRGTLEGVHGFFGTMSVADWQRWAYKHTDHHLRQFGL